jgi:hypothetical protein
MRTPARPVGEDGKPVFPAATEDDDVQGHQFIASDSSEEDELKPEDKKPGPQLAI